MTEKNSFDSVAEQLVNIDPEVLKGISRWMVNGKKIYPDTDQEKACFDILKDETMLVVMSMALSLTSATCAMKYGHIPVAKVHHDGI